MTAPAAQSAGPARPRMPADDDWPWSREQTLQQPRNTVQRNEYGADGAGHHGAKHLPLQASDALHTTALLPACHTRLADDTQTAASTYVSKAAYQYDSPHLRVKGEERAVSTPHLTKFERVI